jgi:hypothetical protein
VPHKQPRQKDFPEENGIETIEKPGPEQYVLSRQKEFRDEKGTEQQVTGDRVQVTGLKLSRQETGCSAVRSYRIF